MAQLIIEYGYDGAWREKYRSIEPKSFKNIRVPLKLCGKSLVLGVLTDNRELWREKLDAITQNADYEIIQRGQSND